MITQGIVTNAIYYSNGDRYILIADNLLEFLEIPELMFE